MKKTIFFNLSKKWDQVLDCFHYMIEEEHKYGYSHKMNAELIAICWLSQRIYEKTGIVNLEVQELSLPFDYEIAIYQDSENLLKSDYRLSEFDRYLDIINFNGIVDSGSVIIKIINKIMIVVEK